MVDKQILWLSWYGVLLDERGGPLLPWVPAGDLNPRRPELGPLMWERWPDGSGWFNRLPISIPPEVIPGRTLLHGYRLHSHAVEVCDPFWLPFAAPVLFEERLPLLPPGALQLRPGALEPLPSWRVFGSDRNPAPRWDRRQSLYTNPEKPNELTAQCYFDKAWRLLSVETLNVPRVEKLDGHPDHSARAQTTRMWVKFEH